MHELSANIEPLRREFEQLEQALAQPGAAQHEDFAARSQRYAQLREVVALDDRLNRAAGRVDEARAMLGEADPELRALAEAELAEAQVEVDALLAELRSALLPQDPQDARNAIVEIRAGTGGEEAALFAGDLTRMYHKYAEGRGWKLDFLTGSASELGGVKEITFIVQGRGAYGRFKFESGVHRVQRVPKTESSGRIHTSTATVAVLPEVEDVEIEIKPEDVRVDVFRASGPGGQSVNTTDSAVRITHLPTGIVVACQRERSQHQNKDVAMKLLQARLFELEQRKREQALKGIQGDLKAIEWGSQIRSYVFQPYQLVKDHRTEIEVGNIQGVMDGGLDPFIEGYLSFQKA